MRGIRPGEELRVDATGTRWLERKADPELARIRERLQAEIDAAAEDAASANSDDARYWQAGLLTGLRRAKEIVDREADR